MNSSFFSPSMKLCLFYDYIILSKYINYRYFCFFLCSSYSLYMYENVYDSYTYYFYVVWPLVYYYLKQTHTYNYLLTYFLSFFILFYISQCDGGNHTVFSNELPLRHLNSVLMKGTKQLHLPSGMLGFSVCSQESVEKVAEFIIQVIYFSLTPMKRLGKKKEVELYD